MRREIILTILALATTASADAWADSGGGALEIGVRAAYSVPLGTLVGGTTTATSAPPTNTTATSPSVDMSDEFNGRIPIMLDLGYRVTPNVYVGAFGTYGIVLLNGSKLGCDNTGISCSGHQIELGADVHYHLVPEGVIDPWIGVGVGYEWISVDATVDGPALGLAPGSSVNESETLSGFQFVDVQLGADYKLSPDFGIGPFAMFSLGKYTSESASAAGINGSADVPNAAIHEWLSFGLRGVYDFHPGAR